jgi:hypothetical protein
MRPRCLGVLTAAAVVLSAVVASAAWAAAPEIGRCVSHAGGKYTNNICTKAATAKVKGSFEWEPGAVKNKFTGTGGVGTLETVHLATVICKVEKSAGEMTSSKTVGNVSVTFTGCESAGFKCSSAGAAEGEIATNPLSGTLVWEKFGAKVAIDLVPQSTELFVEFVCGPAPAVVKGSVLAPLPVNKVQTTFDEKFSARRGKQKPEYYYTSKTEKVKDVLMAKIGGPGVEFEQSGQTITNAQTDEEPLEINTKA